MRGLARLDRTGRYELTTDASAADLILYVESSRFSAHPWEFLTDVRRDPIYRQYRSKTLVYSAYDFPIPFVPGIYPSIERTFYRRSRARSGCYLETNKFIDDFDNRPPLEPRLLASFVGCMSGQPVRRRLAELRSETILIADNTEAYLAAVRAAREEDVNRLKASFVEIVSRSKFVLCPRGCGASSIRLFEAMRMGRAPVIISDQWVPPDGPDWNAISIRVSERDVLEIPRILRERESESEALGRAARLAWEHWFSPEVIFGRICETRHELLPRQGHLETASRWLCYIHYLRPSHARRLWYNIKLRLRGLKPS